MCATLGSATVRTSSKHREPGQWRQHLVEVVGGEVPAYRHPALAEQTQDPFQALLDLPAQRLEGRGSGPPRARADAYDSCWYEDVRKFRAENYCPPLVP